MSALRIRTVSPDTFSREQLEVGRRLLLDSRNYDLLLARLTPGGPAVTALLINDGLITR
jgi:hypothetical protein